jgi:DNA-binding MarR family transcriptional regulator
MDESNTDPSPANAESSDVLNRCARDLVGSLDRIMHHMIASAPSEGGGWEIPLTLREVWVAKTISPQGSVTMSSLAATMGISLPTATHLVDRLVAKGVVVRIRPEHDRRLVLVALTERSKTNQRVYFENRVTLIRSIVDSLSQAEREQAVKVLGKIAQRAGTRMNIPAGSSGPE